MPAMSWAYSLTSLFSSTMSSMISGDMLRRCSSMLRSRIGESAVSSSFRNGLSSTAEAYCSARFSTSGPISS